jgi:hypothetical protein
MMMNSKNNIAFNSQPLTIEDICMATGRQARVELSTQADLLIKVR